MYSPHETLALALFAESRRMEKKGDDISLVGIECEDERRRLMSRAGMLYGQSVAFERGAWMALASSGASVDADFFNKAANAKASA